MMRKIKIKLSFETVYCIMNANLVKIDVRQIPYEIFVFKLHTVFEYSAVLTADSNIETLPLRISSCFVKRQQIQKSSSSSYHHRNSHNHTHAKHERKKTFSF